MIPRNLRGVAMIALPDPYGIICSLAHQVIPHLLPPLPQVMIATLFCSIMYVSPLILIRRYAVVIGEYETPPSNSGREADSKRFTTSEPLCALWAAPSSKMKIGLLDRIVRSGGRGIGGGARGGGVFAGGKKRVSH